MAPAGCSSDPVESAAAPPADDVSVVDAMAAGEDTAALLDDIMNPSPDVETAPDEVVATEDTAASVDVGEAAPDAQVVDAGPADVGPVEPEDAGPIEEDIAVTDTGSTADPVAAEGTCLFPTGKDCLAELQDTGIPCEGNADCSDWTGADTVCTDGKCERFMCDDAAEVCYSASCHAGQGHTDPELAAKADACCIEIWESPEPPTGAVPGCTPWGPPAPPEDRGYRLAELVG